MPNKSYCVFLKDIFCTLDDDSISEKHVLRSLEGWCLCTDTIDQCLSSVPTEDNDITVEEETEELELNFDEE